MKYFRLLILLFLCQPLLAQTFAPVPGLDPVPAPASAKTTVAATASTTATTAGTNASADGAVGSYVLDDKYKIASGDRVSFQILEDGDPAKSLVVTDSGELDVPYVGRVVAANKTCKQLAAELKSQLEKEYYYRASVVLALDAANKTRGKVYIWGQVRVQGPVEIPSGESFTAGKAILRAGGFGDFADKKNVKVVRNGDDGKKQTFELNMVNILEKGKTEEDKVLEPDDFIIVPSRLINF